MNYLNDFDKFRCWFNSNFSMSFNGKYKSLSWLVSQSQRLYDLFLRAFARIMNRSKHSKPLGDIICFRVSGNIVKLYSR